MVHCWRTRPHLRGALVCAACLVSLTSAVPAVAAEAFGPSDNNRQPLLASNTTLRRRAMVRSRSSLPEVTPPASDGWTEENAPGHGLPNYLPDAPAHLPHAVDQYQSPLPQPEMERSSFTAQAGSTESDRPRERNRGLRLRKRGDNRDESGQISARRPKPADDSVAGAVADQPRRSARQQMRARQSARQNLAMARSRSSQAEVMETFTHNPVHNDESYIPFLGNVASDEAEEMEDTPTSDPEESSQTGAVAASHALDEQEPVGEEETQPEVPKPDKYAIAYPEAEDSSPETAVADGSSPEEERATMNTGEAEKDSAAAGEPEDRRAVAGRDTDPLDRQPAIRSEPPPPPPLAHAPRVADLEPWRQQQYAPRPTRREVEDYRRRLQDRLLERYNNLPRFAGKVGKVSVVLSKPLDESLDGSLIRAEFDQLVYDPWGKRIPELEQEYFVVTFGAGGPRQVRSDPSIRVGLDLEKTYSEQAPLPADPFRNVPERRVFHLTPTAAMPDWWRPDFPELNQ
ncbi:MAG: hypothetical protein LUE17_00955 [Planctomycetaceae bacterium]|nr:hypothetical protein [Planctomycetaceae bacterium]